jgi:hypothetical protein
MMKIALCVGILACLATWASAAEPLRKVLVSTRENVNVTEWQVASKDVTPDCPVAWSVKKTTLHGGKQEGVDLIVVDNGKLQISVVPTRGLGIFAVQMGDVRLGWDSPVKDIVHPKFMNLQSRGGLGWLEGFNEYLVRCGLEWNGHPGTDKFINNVGDEATMELTLHGKIQNIPAEEAEVSVDAAPPYRLHVRGRVDERMFYGPKLELQTDLSTEPGSSAFRVADVITNRGGQEQEFEIIYHCNHGRPLLEDGATFVAPVEWLAPFNDHAAKGLAQYDHYGGPTPGFIEQVYCLRLLAGKDGQTVAMLRNKAKDRALAMTYSPKELPCFNLWKNLVPETEGYVTGLEPGTNYSHNRFFERHFGRVPKLAPGASRAVTIEFSILVGQDAVKTVADRIAGIQGSEKPKIETKAEKIETPAAK